MTMVRPHATAPPKKTLLPFVGTGRPDLRLWGKWEEEEEEAHHYIQPGISQILIFSPLSSTEEEGAGETFFLHLPPRFFHFGSAAKTKTAAVALDGDRILR